MGSVGSAKTQHGPTKRWKKSRRRVAKSEGGGRNCSSCQLFGVQVENMERLGILFFSCLAGDRNYVLLNEGSLAVVRLHGTVETISVFSFKDTKPNITASWIIIGIDKELTKVYIILPSMIVLGLMD